MRAVCNRLPIGQALEKAGLKAIDRDRPAVKRHASALAAGVAEFLAARAPGIAAQLAELLELEKAKRQAGGDPEAIAAAAVRARKALDALEFGDEWLAIISVADESLAAMAADGAVAGLQQLGATADEVVVLAGDKAAAWGRARAAELVGMKRNAAGDLVPNPNAKWRIDDSTREMLRSAVEEALTGGKSADELKAAIIEDRAFSAERAEAIARTEIARADMAGTMEGYRATGLVMGKRWSTAQDDQVSDECRACEDAGTVGIEDAFPSGADAPPNHPNCRCTVLPVLDDELPVLLGGKNEKGTNMTKLFASIEKAEKQDDGTIKVFGYASSDVVDSDGETVTADAMKAARDGYMAFANVREMHDPKKAAGVAIEYDVQDDGRTWFGAHVVDPVAVLKVETGVYKGFSIGARVPVGGREGKVIKSIELREVSLVDRPANPEAVFTMFKADDAAGADPLALLQKYAGEEIWDVSQALGALDAVMSLLAREASEPNEPAEQVEALRAAVAGLKRFIASEISEDNTRTVSMAADGGDLAKAGKRFSAATKAALKGAHDACKAADAALAALKYEDEEEAESDGETGKAAGVAVDVAKAVGMTAQTAWADVMARIESLQAEANGKAGQVEEVAKAAGLTLPEQTPEALAKAALTELLTLRKAHAELLAKPMPAKGALMALPISKAADRAGQEQETPPVVKADGAVDEVSTLIKSAQARPIRIN